MFFDPTFILLIPALLLAAYAQAKVQATFRRYAQIPAGSRLTGAAVARQLLEGGGIFNVPIEVTSQNLGDHYDPRAKVLRLSREVYGSNSLAALGVAAHEVGHALQHHQGYLPLKARNTFVPLAQFGSNLAFPLLILGILLGFLPLARLGVYLFSLAVLFYLITLPVEFNASRRATVLLETGGYLSRGEVVGARKVLGAAALTYVAAALVAVVNLVRFLLLLGFAGGEE